MTAVLKDIQVDVACNRCGEFSVSAEVIAESQRLLALGCPGSHYECPPELLAGLLGSAELELLQKARSDPAETRAAAVMRWEDDGGYVPAHANTRRLR